MTKTNIKPNHESIESIRTVVKDINDVVGSTLGAKGRLVLTPHGISKDGIAALTNIQYLAMQASLSMLCLLKVLTRQLSRVVMVEQHQP